MSSESEEETEIRLIANVANTQYTVVKEVLSESFDFKLSRSPTSNHWDLLWADTGVNIDLLSKMKTHQKVNHFPTMYCLAQKNNLARNLMRLRKVLPKEFAFFPETWLLPYEWTEFCKEFTGDNVFIIKPEASCQGKGIYLAKSYEHINQKLPCVAQRYIDKPYLVEGLKFDLRIYVLVYGCDPLRIFVYNEGLARFATEPYAKPNNNNIKDNFIHLTNYAINKKNDNFVFNDDEDNADIGHKRSLSSIWKYIDTHGGDSNKVKEQINRIIVNSLCSVQMALAHSYNAAQPWDTSNGKCFEILGFDILLDHELTPWLIEVNHSPSFKADTPFDMRVKSSLIEDTMTLINMKPRKFKRTRRKEFSKTRIKEQLMKKKQKTMAKRDRYEIENLGGYTRIYPDGKNDEYYQKILSAAESEWKGVVNKRKAERKEEMDMKSIKALACRERKIIPKNGIVVKPFIRSTGKQRQMESEDGPELEKPIQFYSIAKRVLNKSNRRLMLIPRRNDTAKNLKCTLLLSFIGEKVKETKMVYGRVNHQISYEVNRRRVSIVPAKSRIRYLKRSQYGSFDSKY